MGVDFLKGGSGFQPVIARSQLDAQKQAIGAQPWSLNRNKDFVRFGAASVFAKTNRDLWAGLSRNVFEDRMREILQSGVKTVAAYGENSLIAKPEQIEPALAGLQQEFGPDELITIKVRGAGHAWGDDLPLLAKLYMRVAQ